MAESGETGESSVWSNVTKAKLAGWKESGDRRSGGQGEVWPVVRNDEEAFLKLLKSQGDHERRVRMYREAVALSTYSHPGIPHLVESNAANYEDLSYKLYIVTQLIHGPTLREHIEGAGPMAFPTAVKLVDRLLDVVEYYHSRDGVHRDIKPDNIILREASPSDAVLVDFGLAWQPQDEAEHATEDAQELGNRFLRLNELAPGSPNKRDPRSDVTFVVGTLFYAMTGLAPSVLEEPETGRRPHQREGAYERIHAMAQHWTLPILALFDKGFAPLLNNRFQSARELRQELNRIMETKPSTSSDEILSEIRRRIEAQGAEQNRLYMDKINETLEVIRAVQRQVGAELGGHLSTVETGFYKSEPRHSWLNIGFDTPGTSSPRFRPTFDFQIIADELIVSAFTEDRAGEARILWRTDVTNPDLGDLFRRNVRDVFVSGLSCVFGT